MNRKLTIVAMVALAAMLIATPVLAAGSSRTIEVAIKEPTRMFMTATITKVIDPGQKIEVRIYMTNRAFREFRGEVADVTITDALCLEWVYQRKYKPIPMNCANLKTLNKVNIKAKVVRNAFGQITEIRATRVVRNQRSIRH